MIFEVLSNPSHSDSMTEDSNLEAEGVDASSIYLSKNADIKDQSWLSVYRYHKITMCN